MGPPHNKKKRKKKKTTHKHTTPSPPNNNHRARLTVHAVTFYNTVSEVRKTRFFDGFSGFLHLGVVGKFNFFFSYLGANISFTPLSQFSSNSCKNFLQDSLGSPKNPVFRRFLTVFRGSCSSALWAKLLI